MAVQMLNTAEIARLKEIASICRLSTADLVRNIIREYIRQEDQERVCEFTADIEEADPEEAAEILALIDSMTEEDHEVVRVHKIAI